MKKPPAHFGQKLEARTVEPSAPRKALSEALAEARASALDIEGDRPVFPDDVEGGLTLRQYYAGKALAGVVSEYLKARYGEDLMDRIKQGARVAWLFADAMIEEMIESRTPDAPDDQPQEHAGTTYSGAAPPDCKP